MMEEFLQSTTRRVALKAYTSSDHISDATSKTIAVTISKNGGAFGNPSAGATNATEIASGWYYVDLSTTDTATLGPIIIRGTSATIDNVEMLAEVVLATTRGATALPNALPGANNGLFIAGTNAATTVTTSFTTTFTGNLTGNIGGNVTGTVGGVSGTTQTLDALQTALNLTHGAGSWATATSVTVSDKTGFKLASDGLALVTAWTVAITGNITGNLSGSVNSVATNVGIDWGNITNKNAIVVLGNTSIAAVGTVLGDVGGDIGGSVVGGVILTPTAFDDIQIETGMNARQALSIIAASAAGKLAGVTTGNLVFDAANNPGTERIASTVTADGRVTVDLSLPA